MVTPRSALVFLSSLCALGAVFACGDDAGSDGDPLPPATTPDATVDAGNGEDAPTSTTGQICDANGFCWENPLPHGTLFRSLWSSGPTDVWGVAYPGSILHYDGAAWTSAHVPTFANFSSVWGSGPNDVWVGGYEFYGEARTVVFHFDGKAWTQSFTSKPSDGGFRHLNSLWGSASNDVWAAGDDGGLIHFDGATWTAKTSGIDTRITQVFGSSASDVWFVPQTYDAETLTLLHFDGTNIAPVSTPWSITQLGTGVAVAKNDLWISVVEPAAGDAGTAGKTRLVHYDGATWTGTDTELPSDARMWGSGPNDVWAVGTVHDEFPATTYHAVILHKDGPTWKPVSLGSEATTAAPNLVAGSGPQSVWLADERTGGVLHFDGAAWKASTVGGVARSGSIAGVWGAAPDDVWAVGAPVNGASSAGLLLHRDAQKWEERPLPPIGALAAIHGTSASDIWAVGAAGSAMHYDGKTWSAVALGVPDAELVAVWANATNDVWVTGRRRINDDVLQDQPIALHFDGATWTPKPPPGLLEVAQIWSSSATDVWGTGFAGSSFRAVHYDGVNWTTVPEASLPGLNREAIWGTGPKDVWIANFHFDGTTWTETPTDVEVAIKKTWGRAANDIWSLDSMGELVHWDGTRWTLSGNVDRPLSMGIVGNALWVTGLNGMIVRKSL